MDRLGQLTAFVRLVEAGSQSAAAEALGLTPAMVGRHLQTLEDHLGTRLLNRTTRRQSLTEAGEAFYHKAAAILELLDEAEEAAAARQAEPRGTLRFTAPLDFGMRYLAQPIALFCARSPQIQIELALNDRVVDLVEEGYDLALRIGQLRESSLIARRLTVSREIVCAAPGYLARHGTPATPQDLARHNCLRYSLAALGGSTWRLIGPDEAAIDVKVAGNLLANSGATLAAAAIAGQGIVMLPSFIIGPALRAGDLVPIMPGYRPRTLDVHAIYPAARNLAPKVRRFVDFLAGHFHGTPNWDEGLTLES